MSRSQLTLVARPTLGERLDTVIENAEKRHGYFPTFVQREMPLLLQALYWNREERAAWANCEGWGTDDPRYDAEYNYFVKARKARRTLLTTAWLDFLARHPTFVTPDAPAQERAA